jgi:hypothetical protein
VAPPNNDSERASEKRVLLEGKEKILVLPRSKAAKFDGAGKREETATTKRIITLAIQNLLAVMTYQRTKTENLRCQKF